MITGLAFAGVALAQSASGSSSATKCPPSTPNCQAAQSGKATVSELVVTGSRIPVANLTSIQPITTLSGVDIQQRGFTNIADAINQTPITGAGVTPIGAQNSFGVGSNYIDLFSLGSQRTLTLVNGYRSVTDNPTNIFANNGGTQVDINDLPTLFVDRAEIVPATGAAVYGSDAIAGVVNIIMKRKYVGEEIDVQGGWSTFGDAPHYTVEAAVGHNFLNDKLNVAVDFQWDQTSNVLNSDRPWIADQLGFVPSRAANAGSDGVPAEIIATNTRISGVTVYGIPYSFYTGLPLTLPGTNTPVQFAGGNLVPYNTGKLFGACSYGIVYCDESGGDGLNLAPLTTLQTGVDRKVFNAMATYDFTDHLHFHATFNYADINATSLDQPNYGYIGFGAASTFNSPFPGGALLISPQNAFLTPQALAVLNANGLDSNGFILSTSNSAVASAPFSQTSQTYNVNFELSGDFSVFSHAFNWTADWARGQNWSQFNTPNIVYGNAASGGSVPDLFGYALDSVIGPSGQPVCRVTLENPDSTNPYISGCVPYNPFGGSAYNNAAAIKYFMANFGNHSFNRVDDGQINVWTNVVKLPAGDARLSLGYEYRRDAAGFTPALASAEGIGYSVPITGQTGSEVANEYYVEGKLPILGPGFNFPWGAYRFELNGAYRHVSNSLAGDNEAWNFGGEFSPIQDITLRGSRSKTFLAPPLTDLFAASTSAYDSGPDPCQVSNINSGPNPAVRKANCEAAFAALGANLADFTNSIVGAQTIPITAGGNPHLKDEIGNSFTYGLLLQPRWVPGLSISGDYIEINISDAIEFAGIAVLLEQCYDTPNYPSSACSDFTRQPGTGQVLTANETFINAGYVHYAGAEYKVDYFRAVNRLPFVNTDRDLGRVDFNVDAVNNRRYVTSVSGLGFDAINTAGSFPVSGNEGMPRWRWIAQFTYQKGPFRFGWTTHYTGNTYFDLTYTTNNQIPLEVGPSFTHDLSLGYDILPRLTLQLNINNILNQAPPYPAAVLPVGYYDFLGRYYSLALHAKF
jgi:outer membrane receptor protein involved in Fe transport